MLIAFIMPFISQAQVKNFDSYPVYTGIDLGLLYTSQQCVFRIWAPTAEKAELLLYNEGTGGAAVQTINMQKSKLGSWIALLKGEQKGKFYTFRVRVNNKWLNEVADPYAKSTGVNGKRAMVVDLNATNPDEWNKDRSPVLKNATDAVIYELHIRDASMAANSGIDHKGKFLGLTQKGTTNTEGLSTGLDHLKELGVTHVHLLPLYDYSSVDEANSNAKYNWGYDPLNYNVPEGSYSTDPYDGAVRIKEFKQLVKTFHDNGLNVVMDVVYNHTAQAEASNFNQLVPGYYYRHTPDGKFSNATACGNETASERPMMRKFMIESLTYWVREYHVDGFRFDLMGVHDIETMNSIAKELRKIKPDILLYGEGWTAGNSPLPDSLRALKKNVGKLDRIAIFSDDIRDGIKGSVFENKDKGFASGKPGMEESIKFGIVASVKHPQIDYSKVNYSKTPYAKQPSNTVTYTECHDNHVLWDKLAISATNATQTERKEMYKLALSIVLTSQGISFLHAGAEFLRSKKGNENSYNAGDSINAIDWSLKTKNKDVFDFVKALIKMRKEHPAFRMRTTGEIADNLVFLEKLPAGVVGYTINGKAVKDSWKKISVYFNGTANRQTIPLENENWKAAILNNQMATNQHLISALSLTPYSCVVLYQ